MTMANQLPTLIYEDLLPTRDYIQEVAQLLGNLQQAFLPQQVRIGQDGLEVGLRGLLTRPFGVEKTEVHASLDFVRSKVRLGSSSWSLDEYAVSEIYNNVQVWLASKGQTVTIERPKFKIPPPRFDNHQASLYATSLWWMDAQFQDLQSSLKEGRTSPILLHPNHLDFSFIWFPYDDKRQIVIGYSTGDDDVTEPYIYCVAYPQPADFLKLTLPPHAQRWHLSSFPDFHAAVLPYEKLRSSSQPVQLFQEFTSTLLRATRTLFG